VVGRDATVDHRRAEPPVGVDNSLVVVVRNRVEREGHPGHGAADLLLHDDGKARRKVVEAVLHLIEKDAHVQARRSAVPEGVFKAVQRNAQPRLIAAGKGGRF
jgi:hypothetical protein